MKNLKCKSCKYFGERNGDYVLFNSKIPIHTCHSSKTIFKACIAEATRCNYYEARENLNEK